MASASYGTPDMAYLDCSNRDGDRRDYQRGSHADRYALAGFLRVFGFDRVAAVAISRRFKLYHYPKLAC
jgi:hypothetical protein